MNQKKAIIIGASSGIGRELAKILAKNGYKVGLCARRISLLDELKQQLPTETFVKHMDVSQPELASKTLEDLIGEMEGLDLIIIAAGTGNENPKLDWDKENETIQTNVVGFMAIALTSFGYFSKMNEGHVVGISSIASLRGMAEAPTYSASKAFVSNFLQGLYYKAKKSKKNICITNIEPGFVDTAMAKGEGLFWVASPEEAARQIYTAIKRKKKHAYVTRKWRIMAWLMKILPDWFYCNI